jgi:transcriptional regulator with XRE-family HTH domain
VRHKQSPIPKLPDRPAARRIGKRIRASREKIGLSQRELALRVGVTARTVQFWEAGETLPLRYLAELAEALHVTELFLRRGGTATSTQEESAVKFTYKQLQTMLEMVSASPNGRSSTLYRKLVLAVEEARIAARGF